MTLALPFDKMLALTSSKKTNSIMNHTPNSNRLHIAVFGRRNSGKSSLVNALTGQDTALVSATPGTTTDPVAKAMEVYPLGPCLFIDTPGFDDEGELGRMRVERTLKTLEKTDIALLLFEEDGTQERQWMELLRRHDILVVPIVNKKDVRQDAASLALRIEEEYGLAPVVVSAGEKAGMRDIFDAILERLPENFGERTITGDRVGEGDVVLLVMPQDIQAPKGRLILPQVQTIRELLDKKCVVVSCTIDQLPASLQALARPPRLIITDSQAFSVVYRQKPAESSLTSFSVLFAAYKGDMEAFVEGASVLALLTPQSRVLIAEACTHAPLTEDIGTVKIPRLLRKRIGEELRIDFVSGNDFPKDLSPYDLIIHCGACMFNRKYVLSRIAQSRAQHVPITNYGVAIAYLTGILDKIVW